MNAEQIRNAESRYMVPTYLRPKPVLTHGEGSYLYDMDGKRYLDFASGIAVTALGHSDPDWVDAVSAQAAKLAHVSNLFYTPQQVELARGLVEHSFADKVFFCNSGTEAVEAALKFSRRRGREIGGNSKVELVAFEGGFHGRTVGALSLTARKQYQAPFAPLMPGVQFAKFNDLESAAAVVNQNTCAVFVEPIQGEGGVRPANQAFLEGLRELCDRHQTLLVFDEIQCGLGRSGTLWAHERYGVEPDIMTLAKPLAGGLPIGATLVRQEIAAAIRVGDHGSTFAGGPLVCAAAQVVFEKISQNEFLANVRARGEYLLRGLSSLPFPQPFEVRGAGLLVGVDLQTSVKPIVETALQQGLLVINAGENVLRMAPPLNLKQDELDEGLELLERSLASL